MIHMTKKEQVDWFIPFPGELLVIPNPPRTREDQGNGNSRRDIYSERWGRVRGVREMGEMEEYLIPSDTVPPSIVKSAISKPRNLCKNIQNTLKNDIKSQQIKRNESTVNSYSQKSPKSRTQGRGTKRRAWGRGRGEDAWWMGTAGNRDGGGQGWGGTGKSCPSEPSLVRRVFGRMSCRGFGRGGLGGWWGGRSVL